MGRSGVSSARAASIPVDRHRAESGCKPGSPRPSWRSPGSGPPGRRWRSRSATWPRRRRTTWRPCPGLLAIAFYIIGAAIVGFGFLKLKRHVDHPQQTTIGSGVIAIVIGVALIAAPFVINALGATFGIDGGSHTVIRPRL